MLPAAPSRRAALGTVPCLVAVVLALVAPAGVRAADPTGGNLLANGTFEGTAALDGWSGYQAAAAQTTGHTGSAAVALTRSAGTAAGARWGLLRAGQAPVVPTTQPRRTYTTSAWIRRPSGATAPATVLLRLRERDAEERVVDETTTVVAPTAAWQRASVALTSTTGGRHLTLEIVAEDDASGAAFAVDDVRVTTSGLPASNVHANPSFEQPSGATFVGATSGVQPYAATLTSVGDATAPFGRFAAEIRTDGTGTGAGVNEPAPKSVAGSVAGLRYTGRAWFAGVPGSTVGRTARVTVREWTPDYGSVVRTETSAVTLSSTYQEAKATLTAAAAGDRVEVYVALDGTPAVGLRYRVDGLTLTPEALPAGNVIRNPSFEDDTADWTAYAADGSPAASITSALPASSDPGPALGDRAAVVRNGTGSSASPWYSAQESGSVPFTAKSATYTATAYVAGRGASVGRTLRLGVRETTPAGARVGEDATASVVLTADPRPVTVSRTAQATGNSVQVYALRSDAAAGEEFLLDAVGVTATPIAPATAATCAWSPSFPVSTGRSPGWWPPSCWRPHAAASPFNTPIDLAATPYASSGPDPVTAELTRSAPTPIVAGEQARSEPNPTFYAAPSDPEWQVVCVRLPNPGCPSTLGAASPRFRAPTGMLPAGPTDAHLTVVDAAGDTEHDLWSVTAVTPPSGGNPGRITAGSYGAATPGPFAGSGIGQGGSGNAAFSLTSGIIRAQELRDGRIDHALAVYVPCADQAVWPADVGNDPDQPCEDGLFPAGGPRVGQRMKLDMTAAEITALDVPLWRKAILRALVVYGAYVSDTTPVYCQAADGGFRPWGPEDPCSGGERQVQQWGFEYEGSTTYTAPGIGVPDQMVTFGRSVGLLPFDEDGLGAHPAAPLDSKAETTFDLGAGVDWSRLRMLAP